MDQRVSFRQEEREPALQELETTEKFKILKDLAVKINEKLLVLEQKMLGSLSVDLNINESYYET